MTVNVVSRCADLILFLTNKNNEIIISNVHNRSRVGLSQFLTTVSLSQKPNRCASSLCNAYNISYICFNHNM